MKPIVKDTVRAFRWMKSNNRLMVLDQLRIPWEEKWIICKTHAEVASCISKMNVRGAPAIGCVAAYGLLLAAYEKNFSDASQFVSFLYGAAQNLLSTRPTAVNLHWALERMKATIRTGSILCKTDREKIKKIRTVLETEANKITQEDLAANKFMGELGSKLLPADSTVLTHCNTGSLATAGWGTALGVIRSGYQRGKIKKVLVDETRPYLQGARLTAWELKQDKIPFELITDNMAAHLMKTEKVDAVLVGADRIASNGDVANKIGTYALAVLCYFHKVPFYVVAPTSTVDLKMPSGNQIPIEERSPKEVTHIKNINIAPSEIRARHPAFDVTPSTLITAIITEKGLIQPPSRQALEAQLSDQLPRKPIPALI